MINDISEIESLVVEGAGQSFTGDDFRSLRRPGVYALMLGDVCLYIGMGRNMLGRIGGESHHCWLAIRECDKVLLWPCKTHDAAFKLELILIRRLKPRYNKVNLFVNAKKMLGITGTSHVQRYLGHGDISLSIDNKAQ